MKKLLSFSLALTSALVLLGSCTTTAPAPAESSTGSTVSVTGEVLFQLLGVEPSWDIKVYNGASLYSTIGADGTTVSQTYATTLADSDAGYNLDSADGTLHVVLQQEACSDNMSDTVYSYSANGTV
jgi:uncharacterized membrane protein